MGKKINFNHPKNFNKMGERGYNTPVPIDATSVQQQIPPDPILGTYGKKPYPPRKPEMPNAFDTTQVPRP